MEDRNLDCLCPGCFSRTSSHARYCIYCGIEIQPQHPRALAENDRCPRCSSESRVRVVGNWSLIECTGCGGIWLPPGLVEKLCASAEEVRSPHDRANPRTPSNGSKVFFVRDDMRYLPCLCCYDLMVRQNYQNSGIVIDICRNHGVWLDHGEIQKIAEFMKNRRDSDCDAGNPSAAALRLAELILQHSSANSDRAFLPR